MSTISIPLGSRKYPGKFAIIDECDAHLVAGIAWHVHLDCMMWYATHTTPHDECGKQQKRRMHRVILGVTDPSVQVDHINGNGLDNRRCNLRIATNSENAANRKNLPQNKTSRYRGVTWHRGVGKWQAAIKVHGKNHYLGVFPSDVDAAIAYNRAAKVHFGEFAVINEIPA